jgi:hypothetical protein
MKIHSKLMKHSVLFGGKGFLVVGNSFTVRSRDFTPESLRLVVDKAAKVLNRKDQLELAETAESPDPAHEAEAVGRPFKAVRVATIRKKVLESFLDFCSNEDYRYYGMGVAFLADGSFVASDSMVLNFARGEIISGEGEGESAIIPRVALEAFLSQAEGDLVFVSVDSAMARLETEDLVCDCRCIAGAFPAFEAAFPRTMGFVANLQWDSDLELKLARADRNKIIEIDFDAGEETSVKFNGSLLKKVLKHSTGEVLCENVYRPFAFKGSLGQTILLVPSFA